MTGILCCRWEVGILLRDADGFEMCNYAMLRLQKSLGSCASGIMISIS